MERDLCLKWCNETNSEFKTDNRKKTNKHSDNRQIVTFKFANQRSKKLNRLDGKIALFLVLVAALYDQQNNDEAGAKVIGDIIEKEGQELAEKLGPNASFIPLDVTMEEDWREPWT